MPKGKAILVYTHMFDRTYYYKVVDVSMLPSLITTNRNILRVEDIEFKFTHYILGIYDSHAGYGLAEYFCIDKKKMLDLLDKVVLYGNDSMLAIDWRSITLLIKTDIYEKIKSQEVRRRQKSG